METHFIISLSTLPSRYESLKLCLKSLFEQNYSNYEIHLNIPKYNKFEGAYTHKLKFNNNKLKIYYIDDIGPISKIYYTLDRTKNKNQRIISVDDDMVYNKNMLKVYNTILSKSNYLECCIGFSGIYPVNNINTFFINKNTNKPIYVGILEGYKSICYKREFFNNDFFTSIQKKDMPWAYNKIYYEDDVVISSYLGYKKIMKVVMPHKFINDNILPNIYISFPIDGLMDNKPSGCDNYRKENGNSINNIKEFHKSDYGQYIH